MRRVISVLGTLVTLLTVNATAAAQERLAFLEARRDGSKTVTEVDVTVSGFGRVVSRAAVSDPRNANPQTSHLALAGGRYLAWLQWNGQSGASNRYMVVFDRRTRTTIMPPIGALEMFPDPVQPRVFYVGDGLRVFDARTAQSTLIEASADVGGAKTYAADTDLYFLVRRRGLIGGEAWISGSEVSTGTERVHIPVPFSSHVGELVVDRGGRRVFARSDRSVTAYDTTTGLQAGQFVASDSPDVQITRMTLDEQRGWLYLSLSAVATGTPQVGSIVIDARTLSPLAQVAGVALVPGRWMTGAYSLRHMDTGGTIIDALTPTGGLRSRVALPDVQGHPVLMRSPFEPTGVKAVVEPSRSVGLSWSNPGDSTGFEVSVGTAPGSTFLTQRVGDVTAVTFAQVPPGVYYVRVRAFNELGASPTSSELRVVVE